MAKELTSSQVAKRLDISVAMVRQYVYRRRLPVKKRVGKENYFSRKAVKDLEKSRKPVGNPNFSKK